MRRSTFLLSSWALALVLVLTTLVGSAAAGSPPRSAGAAAAAAPAVALGTLCVVKFNDLDGNGKQGPNEPTLSGWVFTIKDANGNVVGTITTSAAGASPCIDLPPGTYTVTETPQSGWTPTAPVNGTQQVTVVAGQTVTATFGNNQVTPGRICAAKFNDLNGNGHQDSGEPLLSGWVVTIKDASGTIVGTLTTSATGAPPCINLPTGTYTVTETPQAGWTPTTPGGATQSVAVISGQSSIVIFGNRKTENGRLCVVKFNDLNGNGKQDPGESTLSGWVFTILDASGNVVGTLTTSANGDQNCINLPPGAYKVTETPQAGWTPTTVGGVSQIVTVTQGQTTIVIFGNQSAEKGRLCVVKFNDLNGDGKQNPGEPTLVGWVFTVKDASGNVVGTITTGDLAANCIDLPAGTYTVIETSQPGWTPTTPGGTTQTATVTAGHTTTVTFGNHQGSRICVTKFEDVNDNGKQDTGEPLLANWTFSVIDTATNAVIGTLVSGTNRNCIDVQPGTYTVTETLQAGWTPTTPGGVTQTVTVAAGQTINVIFGNHRCCLTFTFLGGKIDNFSTANGATAEPVTPPVITAPPAYFDATKGDRAFAHRFYLGTGNCMTSATLEIRIKALPGGSTNDTLGIKVPGGASWAKSISAIAPTGTWTPPKVKTLLFNLGAMPSGGGSSNLIPTLDSIRSLDINIQDDTSVDYIKLVVVFCECGRN